MEPIKSVDYLPELLQNEELFISITNLLDRAIQLGYITDLNALTSIYDPSSDFYDSERMTKLLGGETLDTFLNNHTDKISLSLILSDIHNIKGTEAGFLAVLKLLNLEYQSLKFTVRNGGCTDVTLILSPDAVFDANSLTGLENLTRELFPINLTLVGVTNCLPEGVGSLISQDYDYSVVADYTLMDKALGSLIPEISSTVYFRICLNKESYLEVPNIETLCAVTHHISNQLVFDRVDETRLDYKLRGDYNTWLDHIFSPTGSSDLYDSMVVNTNLGISYGRNTQICIFQPVLDFYYPLDYDLAPLDGAKNNYLFDGSSYDSGILDTDSLDSKSTILTIRNCTLIREPQISELTINSELESVNTYSLQIITDLEDPELLEDSFVSTEQTVTSVMLSNDAEFVWYNGLVYNEHTYKAINISGYYKANQYNLSYVTDLFLISYDSTVTIVII